MDGNGAEQEISSCVLLDSETNGTGTGYGRFVSMKVMPGGFFLSSESKGRADAVPGHDASTYALVPEQASYAPPTRPGDADEVIPIASGHTLSITYEYPTVLQQSPGSNDFFTIVPPAASPPPPPSSPPTCLSALGYSPLSGAGMGRCWKRDKKDGGSSYNLQNNAQKCNSYAEPVSPGDPSAGYRACEVDASTEPDRCIRSSPVLCAENPTTILPTTLLSPRDSSCARRHYSPHSAVGHTVEQISGISVAACDAACCSRPWCTSFDFAVGAARCELSNATALTAGLVASDSVDHYGAEARLEPGLRRRRSATARRASSPLRRPTRCSSRPVRRRATR